MVTRHVKRLLKPLMKPWLRPSRAISDLHRIGVRPGGMLLVHSSLSAMGFVPGGSCAVINFLRRAVGPSGTLVFPTHSWRAANAGERVFDVRNTPSCVGTLTEVFRNMRGSHRSLHPTHSVAASGPAARELIRDHHLSATPCGVGTPYHRLLAAGGQILLLGVGLESNTAFHTVEALADVDYLMNGADEQYTLIGEDRIERHVTLRRLAQRIPRRFRDLQPLLVEDGIAQTGFIGPAESVCLDGGRMLERLVPMCRRDPHFLLRQPSETCVVTPTA